MEVGFKMETPEDRNYGIKAASILLSSSLTFAFLCMFIAPVIASEDEATIILTTADDWHYGAIASGFAAANNHAMLLNPGFMLDENVKSKMEGFDRLIVIGNEKIVSPYIELQLNTDFIVMSKAGHWPRSIERVSGADVYETSANLADMWSEPQGIIVTRSDVFADALVATQLSAAMKAPILFTDSNSIPDVILNKIKELKLDVIIIGGTAAVSSDVEKAIKDTGVGVERIGGKDRFETSTLVAERFIYEMKRGRKLVSKVAFIDGETGSWSGALGLNSYTGGSAILLMGSFPPERDALSESVKAFLDAHQEISNAVVCTQVDSTELRPYLVNTYLKQQAFEVDDLEQSRTDAVQLSLTATDTMITLLGINEILEEEKKAAGGGGGGGGS